MGWLTAGYRRALDFSIRWKFATMGLAVMTFAGAMLLAKTIGSEFLPHLDEGAIWARGTLASSTGPTQGEEVMRQARIAFASFPEVTQVPATTDSGDAVYSPTLAAWVLPESRTASGA